jgi:hypothetical protein
MDYSKKTADLIERMCRNVEREDFVLEKEKAVECLMKTYDLFDLPRPKKVEWVKDIFDKKFDESAWSARSAGSALSARSSWSARSAGSAWSAWSAGSAGSAGSALSARSAGSARSARSAGSLSWLALDYDFDWYVVEYEYCENPDADKQPNNNDKKYLEYCELLMQAKEYGMGYRIEWEDTLYCCPTPLVKIDKQNRFHSITQPAIRWKGGKEFYFINGVLFEKSLWEKVVKDSLTPQEVFAIENTEQRRIAYELMDKTKMRDLKDYKILDEVTDDGKSYGMKIVSFNVDGFNEPFIYLNCFCPTTGREYFIQTKNTTCWEAKNNSFGLENVEWINEW